MLLGRIEPEHLEPEESTSDSTTTSSFEQPIGQEASQSDRTEAQTVRQVIAETNPPSATQTARASTMAQTVKQIQTVPQTTTKTPVYEEPREMCCGDYSDHRFPYYSLNRGCCNGKTFDTLNLQCCDGVIKSIFSEC